MDSLIIQRAAAVDIRPISRMPCAMRSPAGCLGSAMLSASPSGPVSRTARAPVHSTSSGSIGAKDWGVMRPVGVSRRPTIPGTPDTRSTATPPLRRRSWSASVGRMPTTRTESPSGGANSPLGSPYDARRRDRSGLESDVDDGGCRADGVE